MKDIIQEPKWRDQTGVKARCETFDAENTIDGLPPLPTGTFFRYSTGAKREQNPIGLYCDPPRDPALRAKEIVKYHQLAFDRASMAFQVRKTAFEDQLRSVTRAQAGVLHVAPLGFDEDAAVAELEELRDEVRKCHRRLMKARDEVERSRPTDLVQRESADRDHRAEASRILGKIRSIEV